MVTNTRKIQDYECENNPNLILIAARPLKADSNCIFDSIIGIEYLSKIFKSKFNYLNTYVTYIDDPIFFMQDYFYNIFRMYTMKNTLNINKVAIGFIGKEAFDLFYNRASDLNYSSVIGTVKVKDDYIRMNCQNCYNNKLFKLPYVILPDINENLKDITNILNNLQFGLNDDNLDDMNLESPYCSTQALFNRLNELKQLYEEHKIYNISVTGKTANNVLLYLKLYDTFTKQYTIYCPKSEICENDTNQIKKDICLKIREVLKAIPLCGENCKEITDVFGITDKVNFVTEKDLAFLKSNRASFKLFGDKNGIVSEWYSKWHEKVLPILGTEISEREGKNQGYNQANKYEWIYDIEVFKEDWLFVAKTVDKQNKIICWNDPKSLAKWISNKILIGFNNAAYDNPVISYAMSYDEIKAKNPDALTVKEFSDKLIHEETNYFAEAKNVNATHFLSWDISFHEKYDIRRNSLKKLTMAILNKKNYDSNVPFDIDRALTDEERKEVEKYCELDVDNTLELFMPDPEDVKKKEENPKYEMRTFARESYDIRWNMIIEYNMTAKTLINKSSSFAGKLLCGEGAKADMSNTYKVIDGKKVYYSIPDLAYKELAGTELLQFYIDHQSDPDYHKESFEVYMGGDDEGHLYQFGFGGLHQALIGYSSENLVNMDVASLYPSLLVQYSLMSRGATKNPKSYEEVYHTRLKAKHEHKQLLNLGLKLILNGAIGAMKSEFNPLYDTWSNSTICVYGQLLLFILCKRLFNAGFNIVQTNTDGIMIEKRNDVDYMLIAEQWMKETRLVLEFDDISVLQQNNVNNYYCQFTNGKVKSKGFYLSNEKFGKATSKILCNMVTHKPLLEGTVPGDYVIYKRHGVGEIYDAKTNTKLEGRSLAFVIGYPNDERTGAFYSRSRNQREIVVKDEKGKAIVDENGNKLTELTNSESKITGFTDHMLVVDSIDDLTMEEINTREYINLAKNLLDKPDIFGPYYDVNFVKVDEPAYLQALNPLKDNTDPYPTKAGVKCQNFLFECDYLSKEEQEEIIKRIEPYTYRITWSGHRSYHIVVRLTNPVKSTDYKMIWHYLAKRKLNIIGADEACELPNKYTRVPGQINPKTNEMQTLYSENKYEFSTKEILDDLPVFRENEPKIVPYKGKNITLKTLEKHINKQDWSEGNRFVACQKLSPNLMSLVSLEDLLKMIPVKLDKDHIYVLKSKYHYWEKYKYMLEESGILDEGEI